MINTKHAQAIAKKLNEKAVQVVGNIKIAKWPSMFTSQCWMTNVCLFSCVFVPCTLTKGLYRPVPNYTL